MTHRGMIMLDARTFYSARTLLGCLAVSVALAGCGSGSGSGLSTASVLGEAPASATAENPGITKSDPMARPVQVAWTSARAEKCGFSFDAARLKASYLAYEQSQGTDAAKLGNITKSYDLIWLCAMVLGVVAAGLHWPIDDRELVRPGPTGALA